ALVDHRIGHRGTSVPESRSISARDRFHSARLHKWPATLAVHEIIPITARRTKQELFMGVRRFQHYGTESSGAAAAASAERHGSPEPPHVAIARAPARG